MSNTKYLYFQIDFFVGGKYNSEWICEDLDEVHGYLQSRETDLDDETMNAEVRIKGIGMTKAAYKAWRKSILDD